MKGKLHIVFLLAGLALFSCSKEELRPCHDTMEAEIPSWESGSRAGEASDDKPVDSSSNSSSSSGTKKKGGLTIGDNEITDPNIDPDGE